MNAILVLILRGVLLLLVYVFVGWIGLTLYRDMKTQVAQKPSNQIPAITIKGTNDWVSIEKTFQKKEFIIGRDTDSDLSIPDSTISLQHCTFTYHHKQWWLNDLESTNGSFLNENPTESPVIVANGDHLRLGNVILSIHINT